MRYCPRCSSRMVQEPFRDPSGCGQRWLCLLCGECVEQYEEFRHGMTPAQLEELMQPTHRGRPRRAR